MISFWSHQNIFEAVSNVQVHIGAADLKFIAYYALLPQYLAWSKGYPLSIDECQLRDKDWVELIPKNPDVDVIADRFFEFKGKKARAKSFTPKKGAELSLSISYETYDDILTRLVELDDEPQVCFITILILC